MKPGGRLLLLGGGHAHLFVLEALARGRLQATEFTLVSPYAHQLYGAMVPGYIGGRYRAEEISIDLRAVTRAVGGSFVEGALRQLAAGERIATLEDGSSLRFDVASVSIGGHPAGTGVPGARQYARFVKPAPRALELGPALDAAAAAAGPEPLQVVVIGGGALGFEIALATRARLDRLGASRAIISLLDSSHTALRDRGLAAQQEAEVALGAGEITLRLSTAVEEVGPNHVRVTGGRVIPADLVIWAAGTEAPPIFQSSGLPTDAGGYLTVDDTLAVSGCPGLFGAGEAVSLASAPRTPRSGAYPVQQGPVLAHNLGIALRNAGADRFRSAAARSRSLGLLNCGDGSAILCYGTLAVRADWVMVLKDRIDRRFVRRFQRLGG